MNDRKPLKSLFEATGMAVTLKMASFRVLRTMKRFVKQSPKTPLKGCHYQRRIEWDQENWFYKINFYPCRGYGNPAGESRQIGDRMGKLLIKCQGGKKARVGKGNSLILALIIKYNLVDPIIIAEGFKINLEACFDLLEANFFPWFDLLEANFFPWFDLLEANFFPWFDKQIQQNRFPSIFDRL